MWFPEMGRLGNDCLCVLEASIAWGLMVRQNVCAHPQPVPMLGLGVVIGLGIVTKAFFLPVALAVTIWALIEGRRLRSRRLAAGFVLGLVAVIGPWATFQAIRDMPLLPINDLAGLRGIGDPALTGTLAATSLLHSLGSIVRSFLWGGTWSLVRPPLPAYLPLALLAAAVSIGWALGADPVRRKLLPLWLVLPFAALLVASAVIWLAQGKTGVTPGWYLHILIAPLSCMAASGLERLCRWPWGRAAVPVLCFYSMLFWAACLVQQVLLFAGCAGRAAEAPVYVWLPGACPPGLALSRMEVLAWPHLGLAALSIALGAAGSGAWRLWTVWRQPRAQFTSGAS
jgi:hypothetical protein